jgi:uncharacterized protein YcbX
VDTPVTGRRHAQAGIVSGLWRFPVKSMAGEPLAQADVSWAGLAGDRRWAFVRPDSQASGFPWHTIRELPQMSNYVALLSDPARADRSRVLVRTPAGDRYDVTDPRLAAELGPGVRVMRLDRGAFDAMPVSLISDSTVSALCALADVPRDELRFRPNIVVTLGSGAPFEEDEWVGAVVRIGTAVVRIDRRDSRCVIVNVDPASGAPGARLLRVIGTARRARAGVYGTTVQPGVIRAGDPVVVEMRRQGQAAATLEDVTSKHSALSHEGYLVDASVPARWRRWA